MNTKFGVLRLSWVSALGAVLMVICTSLVASPSAVAGHPMALAITTQTTLVQPASGAGYKFFDTATLSGTPSGLPAPTGTITFDAYGPIAYPLAYGPWSCAGTPQYSSTNPVNAAGTGATSNTFIPPPGEEKLYLFTARYSGDALYAAATSECGAPRESVTVPDVEFADVAPGSGSPLPSVVEAPLVTVSDLTFSPAAFSVMVTGARDATKAKREALASILS